MIVCFFARSRGRSGGCLTAYLKLGKPQVYVRPFSGTDTCPAYSPP